MKKTAVIIARFQTPFLHDGHTHLIDQVMAKHNKVVVVLGVSPVKSSKRNPYDFHTREKMIKASYPNLLILPLADNASDSYWSNALDQLLGQTFPNESFVLFGSRDSFLTHYNGKLLAEPLPAHEAPTGTDIREFYSDDVKSSQDFRLGINYACHNAYAKVYPTVDIAVIKDDMVLLGKKPTATAWRFPGGYADPIDANFEAAAKRELQEECGDILTGPMQYVGSAKIDDWRYRNEEDKIITTFFKTAWQAGEATANDDLKAVQWCAINQLENMLATEEITKEHHVLVRMLLTNLNNLK